MPTRKSTTKQSNGKGKKKGIGKTGTGGPGTLEQDPPIVVGGGGSVYIWMHKRAMPQIVDPKMAPAPPARAENYFCIKCEVNIKKIKANDGFGGAGHGDVYPPGDGNGNVHPTDHKTVFTDY